MLAPRIGSTAGKPLFLLLVEDDRADALLVEELVADAVGDIRMNWAASMADPERELADGRPDCVLLDLNLPDANGEGLDFLYQRGEHQDAPQLI